MSTPLQIRNLGLVFKGVSLDKESAFKLFFILYFPLALILIVIFYGIFQIDEAIQLSLLQINKTSQVTILSHILIYCGASLILLAIVVAYLSVILVSHRKSVDALNRSSKEITDLYNNAPCGYHSLDINGIFVRINNTELEWIGYSPEEVIGKMKFSDLLTPVSNDLFQRVFPKFKEQGFVHDLEYEIKRKDGSIMNVLLNATAAYDAAGNYIMSRSTLFDITDRQRYEARIHDLAYHDGLTMLPNRQLLMDRITQSLAKTERSRLLLAVMFLDLDKFKDINDHLGHDVGDELLKAIAVRLSASVRDSDTVARSGGDEFIIVLSEINEARDAELIAKKIVERVSALVYVKGQALEVSVSIGIALYPFDGENAVELMKKADLAMYAAKQVGGNRYHFYS
ncbi:MAG: yegE 3 [Gammaproteobacteria bacterium]|jgi:diguanylate cyclase (GGDEF)-like protein/PAS domain S-box-containing protein|nr:yegE 3 [Gammaproteobacteria bacterium]